jgi:DNA uptake protein ComE-like DNA-binding protein
VSLSGEDKLPLKGTDPESLVKRLAVTEDQAKALTTYGAQANAKPENLLVTPLSQLAAGSSGAGGTGGTGGSRGTGGGSTTGGSMGGAGRGGNGNNAVGVNVQVGGSTGSKGGGSGGSTGGTGGASGGSGGGSSGRSSGGRSGAGGTSAVADLNPAQLRAVLREITSDDFSKPVPGRMNINTVPESVLKEVLDFDPRLADAIVARRKSKPEGIVSLADLSGMSGVNPQVLSQIATQFDVTSSVYTVTSRGRAASTGAEVEIEVVIDKSELPAKILSYREQ